MHTEKIITGKSALVVDDQASIRLVLSRILGKSGVLVSEAASGMEALVEIGNKQFDVIFMDLNMPELSGEESIKAIKQLNPNARIIVYSAYADQETRERLVALGVVQILEKPATSYEILHAVKRALEPDNGSDNVAEQGESPA